MSASQSDVTFGVVISRVSAFVLLRQYALVRCPVSHHRGPLTVPKNGDFAVPPPPPLTFSGRNARVEDGGRMTLDVVSFGCTVGDGTFSERTTGKTKSCLSEEKYHSGHYWCGAGSFGLHALGKIVRRYEEEAVGLRAKFNLPDIHVLPLRTHTHTHKSPAATCNRRAVQQSPAG